MALALVIRHVNAAGLCLPMGSLSILNSLLQRQLSAGFPSGSYCLGLLRDYESENNLQISLLQRISYKK